MHKYGNNLVAYQINSSNKQSIVIPQQLQYPAVRWLHSILGTCLNYKTDWNSELTLLVPTYEGNDNKGSEEMYLLSKV